jgi:hypothetical protein
MTLSPALVLAFTVASLYGLVFYIVFGKGWARLPLYWLVGVIGFAIGQWLGTAIDVSFFSVGSVNLLEGTLVSWLGLFAVRALQH